MKYIVEESSGYVRGGYEPPLRFSISGHFVIDVPTSLGVAPVPAYSDLVAAKVAAIRSLHPALPEYFSSEFFDGPGTDVETSLSSYYSTGPWKRTSVMGGPSIKGIVRSPVLSIGVPITKLFFHCTYYLLHQKPSTGSVPGSSELLYNYDAVGEDFIDAPTGVTATLCNESGTNLLTFTPGFEQSFVSDPVDVRVAFQNTNTSGRIWVSDWILLYG